MPRTDAAVLLIPIEGSPPDLRDEPVGCPFAPRCARRLDVCWRERPLLRPLEPHARVVTAGPDATHWIACHNPATSDEAAAGRPRRDDRDLPLVHSPVAMVVPASSPTAVRSVDPDAPTLVEVTDLAVHFPIRRGVVIQRHVGDVRAVDGVSFTIRARETLGPVGESGSGKRRTGRAIVRLVEPTGGSIRFESRDMTHASERAAGIAARPPDDLPGSVLEPRPRMTMESIVAEPLALQGVGPRERRERVTELLRRVGLDPAYGDRYPHEFSGGQRQRIGVARALARAPTDDRRGRARERARRLDPSADHQPARAASGELGLAYLFIAHDLSVVEHISHRTAVMYLGRIAEMAPSRSLRDRPLHPYSIALWSAIPAPRPEVAAAGSGSSSAATSQAQFRRRPAADFTPAAGCDRSSVIPRSVLRSCRRSSRWRRITPSPAISSPRSTARSSSGSCQTASPCRPRGRAPRPREVPWPRALRRAPRRRPYARRSDA